MSILYEDFKNLLLEHLYAKGLFSISGEVIFKVRCSTARELLDFKCFQFTSVERIRNYAYLSQEAAEHTSTVPPKTWPEIGSVIFDHVTLNYKGISQPILKHISFSINDKEKVRTNMNFP